MKTIVTAPLFVRFDMDRAQIEAHLAQTEEHVALGEKHIASQREIVAELERNYHDSTAAKALLKTFEDLQVEHIAHRDRLAKELTEL